MTTEQSPAEAIFFAALDKGTPEERIAYLDAACGDDHGLRQRVERLLAAHPQVGSFLEPPAPGKLGAAEAATLPPDWKRPAGLGRAETILHDSPVEDVGAVIAGKYKLVETLGQGGMGAVFMAQQTQPVKRLVALKLIKLGMDSKQVLARFEAERQALALMDHPNIAKVLDAGTTDLGRPFFVMELVKGVPITRFCDERQLSPRQRLELFIPVCQAIQHAHQKGIIHRDIKPTNVLVALYDDRPVPKVIDFGVAKAAGLQLTDASLMTGFGSVVGTPEYMSPEQAQLNQLDIDTRSDVYALGVLLYELLTGTTPIDRNRLNQGALFEILRIVREEEPPRPSTRLSTSDALASIAATRRTEPARLTKLMRGELDWIVMKCLEKDRSRRYETANGLAHDVERYLHDELVEAQPPTAGYRLRKFARKHRRPVLAVAVVGMVLLLGIIGTSWGYYRAERNAELERLARQEATTQRDAASQASEKAIAAKNDAVAAQDQAEASLARGFVRPLVGLNILSPLEIEPLWELATLESNTVGLCLLDNATRDPQMTAQLLNCAEPALVAAIGLNPDLRQRALALLRPRLDDRTLTLDHRMGIAWLTLMLLDKPGPDSAACVAVIKDAVVAQNHSQTTELSYALKHHDRVAALIAPEPAAELLLANIVDLKLTGDNLPGLANELAALSARLPPDAAARIYESASDALLAAIADPKREVDELARLANALAALSATLPRDAAARICESASNRLLTCMADPKLKDDQLPDLATALATLSTRLPLDAAARICESASNRLLTCMADPKLKDDQLPDLATALATLSARLPPDATARICESASNRLLTCMADPKLNGNDLHVLANAVAALSARVPPAPDAAGRLCESVSNRLLAAITDPEQGAYRSDLADVIVPLSAHLQPDAAARVRQSVSNRFLAAVADPKQTSLWALPDWLAALSGRLTPDAAARIYESASAALLAAIADPKLAGQLPDLADALATLSGRLPPDTAARICESASAALLAAIADPKLTGDTLRDLANALAALSARLPRDAAARHCESMSNRLFAAIPDPKDNFTSMGEDIFSSLTFALASLSERMEPASAKTTALHAIRSLTQERLISLRSSERSDALVESMAMVSRRLPPRLRNGVLNQLIALRLEQPNQRDFDSYLPSTLVRQISTVMQRQEPYYVAKPTPSDVKGALKAPTERAFSTLKLTTPEIVEFLKFPTTLGVNRRAFLDLLERRYGRRFGNQWAFVEYAQAENLGLDLTTRAKRPDPKATLKTIHMLLDEESTKP
jgi:serine/threonine protein kinase